MAARKDLQMLGMMSESHAKSEVLDSRVSKLEGQLEEALTQFDAKLSGIAPIVLGLITAEIDKQVKVAIEKYKTEDRAEDRKLFAQLIQQHEAGEMEVTKQGTIETPEGVHKVTSVETHRRKRAN